MENSHSIASLLPKLFEFPGPITIGSNALIISANLLHINDVQMLPIVQGLEPRIDSATGIKMYATLGGYSVLNAILKTDPKDHSKLLWTSCKKFPIWIGSVKYSDTYDDLLRVFDITRFGDATVEGPVSLPHMATLQEILLLYRNNVLKSSLHASDIGTEMVVISPEAYLIDAMNLMFEKRVRRLFLSREKQNSAYQFISSRDIIRFLFSPSRLEIAKENPERWVDEKLSKIEASEAKIILDGKTVNQTAKEIGDAVDDCLICESDEKVVSRWDIVMKPWKTGDYSFSNK